MEELSALERAGGEVGSVSVASGGQAGGGGGGIASRPAEKRVTFLEHPLEPAKPAAQDCPDAYSDDSCFSSFFVVDLYDKQEAVFRKRPSCSRHHARPPSDDDTPEIEHEDGCIERMEKEGNARSAGCYRAYEGLKPANNGNTSTLKRGQPGGGMVGVDRSSAGSLSQDSQVRCLCFGEVPDKAAGHGFFKRFLKNMAICALLVLYTMLGSFIFLYVEGTAELPQQRLVPATESVDSAHSIRRNATWLSQVIVAFFAPIQFNSIARFFLHFSLKFFSIYIRANIS